MSSKVNIIASTHIDKHGTQLSLSALNDIVKIINSGDKIRVAIEHDMSIPPLGYVSEAKILEGKDGFHYVVADFKMYDSCQKLLLNQNETIYIEKFTDEKFRFIELKSTRKNKTTIKFDAVNFGDYNLYHEFKILLQQDFNGVDVEEIMRKSEIPDPQVIFDLTSAVATYIFGKEVVPVLMKSTLDEMSTDINRFYSLVKNVVSKTIQVLRPYNRPITYIFSTTELPLIEMLIITRDANLVTKSISKEKLSTVKEKLVALNRIGSIAKVQFKYVDDKWLFNYAITKDGMSIGSEDVYNEKNKRMKKFDLNLGYQDIIGQ